MMETLTLAETAAMIAKVIAPVLAQGVMIRRPVVMKWAERFDLDRGAVDHLRRLRDHYRDDPPLMRVPKRIHAIALRPEHVHRVLNSTPEPFATASKEKVAALSHFEPEVSLISHGAARAGRRKFNEEVLETPRAMHALAARIAEIISSEIVSLPEEIAWQDFHAMWYRVVRRIVLGESARDDAPLIELLSKLRSRGNWAFLAPQDTKRRAAFLQRLDEYLLRAEPGSLAAIAAATAASPDTGSDAAPPHQVAHWLFAFEAAGMTTFRTLALLATHSDYLERARSEAGGCEGSCQPLPFLRATILESLRLWPTTPMILRESTEPTKWETGTMPAGVSLLIFVPFFHRDPTRLTFADSFVPEIWLEENPAANWPLIPFSEGPAICPGQNLVLLTTSLLLAGILSGREPVLIPADHLRPGQPLPATLNPYSLAFRLPARRTRAVPGWAVHY